MTCDEVNIVDVFALDVKFSPEKIDGLLEKEEIEFYTVEGTWYFKSAYARDRAKIILLKAMIDEFETSLPASCFE